MPFSTPFKNIKRVIGGCQLIIDKSLNINNNFYLMKTKSEIELESKNEKSYEDFSYLLEGTVKLISNYYNKDLFLAKSGGIDSSAILAGLVKQNIKFY